MNAPLIDILRLILDVCGVEIRQITTDPLTGDVDLDGVTISQGVTHRETLAGPKPFVEYHVTFVVEIPQTYEEPADASEVEVGTYRTPAEALGAALGVVIEHRMAAYQDQLADEEQARACQEDWEPPTT